MSYAPLPLSELAAAFRQRGDGMVRFAPGAAEAFAFCAEWLEASLGADLEKPLTLDQAVRESGWSYEGLRRRLKEAPELNVGEDGAPLVRRCDLPRLGAPRGPRGKYRPRKLKSTPATEAALDSSSLGDDECGSATAGTPDEMTASAVADSTAEQRALAPRSSAPAEEVTSDVESPEERPEAPVADTAASGATRRPRPMRGTTRRHSAKEQFNELRALAARG